jgi:cytochrome c
MLCCKKDRFAGTGEGLTVDSINVHPTVPGGTIRRFQLRQILLGTLMLAASLCLLGTRAEAAGDAAAGKLLFTQKCGLCHSVEQGKNKIGPSLYGVVGRKAGSLDGYTYSDAMKNANRTWNDATLDDYLTNPRQKIPGVKMIFIGLPEETDRQNVIAYLETAK